MIETARDSRDLFRCVVAPIGLIGLIHIMGGVTILASNDAAMITSVIGLQAMPPVLTGAVLLAVGLFAVAARTGLVLREQERAWTLPQEIVLLVQLVGIVGAIYAGQYPNGHVPVEGSYWGSVFFILSDQAPWILLCVSHTVEFLFADCLIARVRAHYEAALKQETADRVQAESLLAMHKDTEFWMRLGRHD
jgi:hypothetical protein